MKYLYTLLIILDGFAIDYCLYPKPSNDRETLEYVFEQDEIKIEIFGCGSFGCGEDTILITRKSSRLKLFDSNSSSYQYITDSQLNTLKELLWKYVEKPYNSGWCSNSYYYTVGGHFHYLSIDLKNNCNLRSDIEELWEEFLKENSK